MYASVNYVTIGSDNGLVPNRRQSFIWTTILTKKLIEIQQFSFNNIDLVRLSFAKWRPFCLGFDVRYEMGEDEEMRGIWNIVTRGLSQYNDAILPV